MKRTVLPVAIAFAIVFPSAAQSSPTSEKKLSSTQQQKIHRKNLHRATTAIRWLRNHPEQFTFRQWRARIGQYRWLKERSLRRLAELRRAAYLSTLQGQAWAWYERSDTLCVANHEGGSHERRTWAGRAAQRRWGRSSNWPPAAQVLHAYLVWLSDSWNSWPTYGRYCA